MEINSKSLVELAWSAAMFCEVGQEITITRKVSFEELEALDVALREIFDPAVSKISYVGTRKVEDNWATTVIMYGVTFNFIYDDTAKRY